MYSGSPVFYNIACQAEQTHTEQINLLIDKWPDLVDDPEDSTVFVNDCPDTIPDNIGEFTEVFVDENGEYFKGKFDYLIGKATDQLEALKVGGLIEELDMKDIRVCNDVIVTNGFECGGLENTGVRAIINTLSNLLAGSENHLCAFVGQILANPDNDGACYKVQVLSESEVGTIISNNCSELFTSYGDDKVVCGYTP